MPAVPVLLFADFACPYSYVTEAALRRMEAAGEVRPAFRAFELHPSPAPLPVAVDGGWEAALRPLADELGLALRVPPAPVRTRKAHEAAAFAEGKGAGAALRAAVYAAHFGEGKDVGRIDVLAAIAAGLGLDESEVKVVLDVDTFAARIAAEDAGARRAGVAGVPTLVVGEGEGARVLVGARPFAELRREILNG
jgi:predicted DsbA family dithiol-disulfide isomerase